MEVGSETKLAVSETEVVVSVVVFEVAVRWRMRWL